MSKKEPVNLQSQQKTITKQTKKTSKKVTVFKFECRFEAEVDEGDLDPHQVFPTYPTNSPGRVKSQ